MIAGAANGGGIVAQRVWKVGVQVERVDADEARHQVGRHQQVIQRLADATVVVAVALAGGQLLPQVVELRLVGEGGKRATLHPIVQIAQHDHGRGGCGGPQLVGQRRHKACLRPPPGQRLFLATALRLEVAIDQVQLLLAIHPQVHHQRVTREQQLLPRWTITLVAATRHGEDIGNQGLAKVRETDEALKDIVQNIEGISDSFMTMSAAFEEQSQVSDEINRQVVSIAELADSSTEKAEGAKSASNEVSRQASGLSDLVARFVSRQ